jgi:uncharacterized protein YcbK (DUF882 family)
MTSNRSRVGRSCGLAAILLLVGNNGLQNAVAEGDTRTLSFHHTHRDDDLTITFKRNGRYDEDALKKLNYFLRDWRTDEQTTMDRRLFDVLWEVYRDVDAKQPIQIVSSYRSPQTNAMLRHRGRGVARYSQHMLGKAMDFFIAGVGLEDLRVAGLRLQRGGVGYYPTSGSPFVHVDVGDVRHWPRMTHDQLVRVFPNGRTVHVPSDGQPLSGYAQALAEIEKRGGSTAVQTASTEQADKPQRNFLTALFGIGKDDDDEGEATAATSRTPAPTARQKFALAAVDSKSEAKPAGVPIPMSRPTATATTARPNQPVDVARLTPPAAPSPSEVVAARGFWPPKAGAQPATPPGEQTIAAATPHKDDLPAEIMLGYSARPEAQASSRTAALGSIARLPTAASLGPPGLTTVIKKTLAPLQSAYALARPASLARPAERIGRSDDPWMRAVILTPDVQNFMTTTVLGSRDARLLKSLMLKPSSAVLMTFGDDPNLGMMAEQFSGSAVTFQSTVSFNNRTALLQ